MTPAALDIEETGLEVLDLRSNPAFLARHLHQRDAALQIAGMQRLASTFTEDPSRMLQELVRAAVELCGADSAGISVERDDKTDEHFYHWVATAGQYANFSNAMLPRYPSACGICLERNRPQLFRVSERFFDLMGIEAPIVTDGILLPWQVEGTRGTFWIMAHERSQAFDMEDCRMLEVLTNFAAIGVRQQRQQQVRIRQASTAAAAAMANDLAHQINNPLQSLTNALYLASEESGDNAKPRTREALSELQHLSELVKKLLAAPKVGLNG